MIVRDPLFGFVTASDDERRIMDCELFQRLRGVKQLSYTNLVYPAAMHTRFEHSIGAMHIAGLMADQLGLPPEDRRRARMLLLLHDIGHGPLSHTFEVALSAVGKPRSHEQIGRSLLEGDADLRASLGNELDPLLDIFSSKTVSPLRQILSSGLDADKLDYFRRDSYHTGVEYGRFDFPRILESLVKGEEYLCLTEKALHAIEGFRLARLQLHTQVYTHHARVAAESMLIRAVKLAVEEGQIDASRFDLADNQEIVDAFSLGGRFSDDRAFEDFLLANVKGKPEKMLWDLKRRVLPKRALVIRLSDIPPLAKMKLLRDESATDQVEHELAEHVGLDPEDVIVRVETIDTKQYDPVGKGKDTPILIQTGSGVLELDKLPTLQAPAQEMGSIRVYCPDAYRTQLGEEADKVLKAIR